MEGGESERSHLSQVTTEPTSSRKMRNVRAVCGACPRSLPHGAGGPSSTLPPNCVV